MKVKTHKRLDARLKMMVIRRPKNHLEMLIKTVVYEIQMDPVKAGLMLMVMFGFQLAQEALYQVQLVQRMVGLIGTFRIRERVDIKIDIQVAEQGNERNILGV